MHTCIFSYTLTIVFFYGPYQAALPLITPVQIGASSLLPNPLLQAPIIQALLLNCRPYAPHLYWANA